MLEKLFRIWNQKDKKYTFFSLENTFNLKEMITLNSFLNKGYKLESFTGLTDKNNVKIFENDIVKTASGAIQLVSFDIVQYKDGLTPSIGTVDANSIRHVLSDSDQVIGNINQNPDLLKGDPQITDVFEKISKNLEKEIQVQVSESNKKMFSDKLLWNSKNDKFLLLLLTINWICAIIDLMVKVSQRFLDNVSATLKNYYHRT